MPARDDPCKSRFTLVLASPPDGPNSLLVERRLRERATLPDGRLAWYERQCPQRGRLRLVRFQAPGQLAASSHMGWESDVISLLLRANLSPRLAESIKCWWCAGLLLNRPEPAHLEHRALISMFWLELADYRPTRGSQWSFAACPISQRLSRYLSVRVERGLLP
jgi:hypothetical protein